MTDEPTRWTYPPEFRQSLLDLGLAPRVTTPPARVREAVNDLYRVELRALRSRLREGRVARAAYHDEVVLVRRKYWLLSLNLSAWERICAPTAED